MQPEQDAFTSRGTREKIKASAFEFRLAQLQEAHRKAHDAVDERLRELLRTIPEDLRKEKVAKFK